MPGLVPAYVGRFSTIFELIPDEFRQVGSSKPNPMTAWSREPLHSSRALLALSEVARLPSGQFVRSCN